MTNNVMITGFPGCGKTTLLYNLIGNIPAKKGFITREIREAGRRTGFQIVTSDGEEKTLASIDIDSPYRVSKYKVDVRGFEEVIERFFEYSENDILYIDEIGKMELFSNRFKDLVKKYLAADNLLIATIAMKSNDPFICDIKQRNDVTVFTLDRTNRDEVYEKLLTYRDGNNLSHR